MRTDTDFLCTITNCYTKIIMSAISLDASGTGIALENALANNDMEKAIDIVDGLMFSMKLLDPKLFSLVSNLLRHANSKLVGSAISALGEFGVEKQLLAEPFRSLLNDDDNNVCISAMLCIRQPIEISNDLLPVFVKILKKNNYYLNSLVKNIVNNSVNKSDILKILNLN